MRRAPFTKIALIATALAMPAGPVGASHVTSFGTVDAIDHSFGIGGGTYNGSLTSETDDAWIAFAATAGDNLTVVFSSATVSFLDGVVFREVTNGVVQVGDVANVTNFNVDQTGSGQDLVVQHGPYGVLTNYVFGTDDSQSPETLNLTAAATGQYAIGISANNENTFGAFTVELSGNTLVVPEPSTFALLGLGSLALIAYRRRLLG